jgi:hypothetical protein
VPSAGKHFEKIKIGFLAPSAFVEGIERWATR